MMANYCAEQTVEQRAEKIKQDISAIRGYAALLGYSLSAVFTEEGRANFDNATRDADKVLEYEECKNGFNIPLASIASYFIQDAVSIDRKLKQEQKPVEELERIVFAGVLGIEGLRKAVDSHYHNPESRTHHSLPYTYDSLEKDIENARIGFEKKYSALLEQKHKKDNLIRHLAQRRAETIYESEFGSRKEGADIRNKRIKILYDVVIESMRDSLEPLSKEEIKKIVRQEMTPGERFALDYLLLKRRYKDQNGKFTEKLGSVLNVWANEGFGDKCKDYMINVLKALDIIKGNYQSKLELILNPKTKEKITSSSAKPLTMLGAGMALALAFIAFTKWPSWVKGNPSEIGKKDLRNGCEIVEIYDLNHDLDPEIVDVKKYNRKGERIYFQTLLSPEFKKNHNIFSWFFGKEMTQEEQMLYRAVCLKLSSE